MNEYTPDQMEHRAITDDLSTGQYRIMQINEEAARREKAAMFDVLAARIKSHDWHVVPSSGRDEVVIYDHSRGERVHGATLAEAVTKAMESEGK